MAHVTTLRLGAVSTGTYFWPGLPAESASVFPFFLNHGWEQEESCADLVQNLACFTTPLWVVEQLTQARVTLFGGLHCLRVRFWSWSKLTSSLGSVHANEMADSGENNIVVAQAVVGAIIGTLLMKAAVPVLWRNEAGLTAGSLNLVGVSRHRQRQGIGLALTAGAMEVLRQRGCARCYIQWTGLSEW